MNMIDSNMQEVNQKAAELRKSRLPVDAPFQNVGMSAQSVNAAMAQKVPSSSAEFYARGGLTNTAKGIVNSIQQKRVEAEHQRKYEEYLLAGERGADNLYKEAIETFGEDAKNWIPPKTFFYDKDGVFLPHKYAESVFLGLNKLQEFKAKENEKLAKQNEYKNVAGVLGNAQSQQQANADILKLGYNPENYDKTVGVIPTAKDTADVNYKKEQTNTQLEDQKLKKAQADWYNRKDYHFEEAKKSYQAAIREKTSIDTRIKNLRKQKADNEKIGIDKNPEIDEQIAAAMADMEIANSNLKREKIALNTIASKSSTEGRKAYWDATVEVDGGPAIAEVADRIDENISMNKDNPKWVEHYGGIENIINGYIDLYMKNKGLHPLLADGVKQELRKRYGIQALSSNSLSSSPVRNAANSLYEQKARELLSKKGVQNPSAALLQSAINNLKQGTK